MGESHGEKQWGYCKEGRGIFPPPDSKSNEQLIWADDYSKRWNHALFRSGWYR